MEQNIVSAVFKGEDDRVVYTKRIYQHDRGIYVRVSGIALPEKYQVHFSNDPHDGISAAKEVSGSDIRIPDVFLRTGKYIYIWLFMTNEETKQTGVSSHQIVIPVEPRPDILVVNDTSSGEVVATLDEEDHALVFSYR